jgi:hypothetical protein
MGTMATLGRSGDVKTIWDPTKPDEVANARRTFDELMKKGYAAFAVKNKGDKGEQIRAFDPQAGRIIMAAPMAGG